MVMCWQPSGAHAPPAHDCTHTCTILLQVWSGGPGCAGPHLQKGPLPCLKPGENLNIKSSSHLFCAQIFPPLEADLASKRPLTRLQERLIKKLGGEGGAEDVGGCADAAVIELVHVPYIPTNTHSLYYRWR